MCQERGIAGFTQFYYWCPLKAQPVQAFVGTVKNRPIDFCYFSANLTVRQNYPQKTLAGKELTMHYQQQKHIVHTGRRQSKVLSTIDKCGSKIDRNSVFDFLLTPVWRQMATKNSVSNNFYIRSSTVLAFSIAAYPVCCNSPFSDSCQTMPSRFTWVPGSQGPRQSGSVATATSAVSVPAS